MLAWLALSCNHSSHYDVDRSVFPVKGVDLSAHNGNVDFTMLKSDTVDFVILKATEGTDFCDAMFAKNYTEARQAGLKVGAYHFFRFDSPGHIQAYHFLGSLEDRTFDLPLAIDVEDWNNATGIPTEEIIDQLSRMLEVIRSARHKAMIYTNRSGYYKYIRGNFPDTPMWICTFQGVPTLNIVPWMFWQHSHKGRVKGVKGDVDLNTFNGAYSDFCAYTERFDSITSLPAQ